MKYLELIKKFPLRPIKGEKAADKASLIYSQLIGKTGKRTRDEEDYFIVLEKLLSDYEDKHWKPLAPRMTPKKALESLMEDNDLTQVQLAKETGIPQSVISEFLSGKRALSTTNVARLAKRFCVSADLFLPRLDEGKGVA